VLIQPARPLIVLQRFAYSLMAYGLLPFVQEKACFVLRFMHSVARRWKVHAGIAKVQPSQASLASENA
jgi:hypothetical protein